MALKVMLISATDHVSGPAKGIFQLMESIDGSVLDFHLYTFQLSNHQETLFHQAARDRAIQVHHLVQRNRNYLSLVRQTLKAVREGGFDIVQTHGFKPTFLGFFARLLCGVKWICFMHGTTGENLKVAFYNVVDNVLQLRADRTVVVSGAQRRKVLGGENTTRVVVLHNAVDIHCPVARSTDAPPLRTLLGLPTESKILLTMGRFSPEKGMDVLIDAFSLLKGQVEEAHLVLLGDGQERLALEGRTQAVGLEPCIHFIGFTETPGDFLAEADVFVLPSRSEGLPNAVLEAMALGIPVVATEVGGVPEVIEDGVSGHLVPPNQPEALAQGLAEVLSDPDLRQRFVREGRRRVEESFSIEARISGLKRIYEEVI